MNQGASQGRTVAASTLGGIEAFLFVLVGVAASEFNSWQMLISLALLFAAILFIRWVLAWPAKVSATLDQLVLRYQFRATLWHDLQEIASHLEERERRGWSAQAFVNAAEWWYSEDLWPYYQMYLSDVERDRATDEAAATRFLRRGWKERLKRFKRRIVGIPWVPRQLVLQRPDEDEARFLVGSREVAMLILQRSIEEGFVVECHQRSKEGKPTGLAYAIVEDPPPLQTSDPYYGPSPKADGIAEAQGRRHHTDV